jgi:hypothetical protein
MVIDDWVGHINQLIVASAYSEHCIIDYDETDVDFDPSHRNTLCKIGESPLAYHGDVGMQCGRHKFSPFIIWKGVQEEEFIVTVGYKCLNLVKCTLCS